MDIDSSDSALIGGAPNSEYTDFPCSVAQERFWLLDRLEPGNPSYSVAVRWRLQGHVSSGLLEDSWRRIIQRHEVLRTIFPEVDGKPVQRVLPSMLFKLAEIDLGRLPEASRELESDRIGLIEARTPFDLSYGPLLRVTLVRLSIDDALLFVTTHQVVSDGWSIGIMAREMGLIYAALSSGRALELPDLPLQYGDYSLWQLNWLEARGTSLETEYWMRQLAGVKPFQVLPDHPRSAAPTTNGAIASRVLARELTNQAQAVSSAHGATLFAAALGALCATLSRYTAADEIVLGTQVSDRDQVELEPMIGQFVNSLILRVKLSDDPRFATLIERLRDTVSDALEHRHIPVERLLAMLKAERSEVNSAPISVNFIFQKTFIENANYGQMRLIDMPSLPAGAIYDLNFFMVERPDGWRLSCQYNTDQFHSSTADRLLLYCERALASGVADPDLPISDLRMSDSPDAARLMAAVNDTRYRYPEITVADLFESLAAARPDAIAVQYGKVRLTRAQQNDAAQRLALALRPHVASPNTRVALCLDRSSDLAVAVLAVLKAGAAFFIVHPGGADDTIRAQLASARALTLITDASRSGRLAAAEIRVLEVSSPPDASGLAAATGAAPPTADAEAYIMTNARAGCIAADAVFSQRALLNLIHSLERRPGVGESDVILSTTAAEDECTALSILLSLATGARLVIATEEEAVTGMEFSHLLQCSGATLVAAPASTWSRFAEAKWSAAHSLKLLCTQDELDGRLLDRLLARSEVWRVRSWPQAPWASVSPVSKPGEDLLLFPIANTTFQLFDRRQRTTLLGAVGDLQVAGAAVTTPEGLCVTGQRARLRADGRLELIVPPLPAKPKPIESSSLPVGDTELRVAKIWTSMLNRTQIDAGANFFELGGHSLLAARMLARIESEFRRRITLATLFRAPTIRGLAHALTSNHRSFDFRQVVKLQPNGSRPALIAVNNTGVYYTLARLLGEDQPVISLQLFDPSLKAQEMPSDIEELAARYVELIRRVQAIGPYYLMGWCAAGPLTFEIARQLSEAGDTVAGLYLMDSWIPGYFRALPLLRRLIAEYSLRWQFFRRDWQNLRGGTLTLADFVSKRVTSRKLTEALRRVTEGRAAVGSRRTPVELELYDQWLLSYLQSITARYMPGAYSGKIVLFLSRREPTGWLFDAHAGWDRVALGGVELHMVDGDHYTMFQQPGVGQIAALMVETLAQSRLQVPAHSRTSQESA